MELGSALSAEFLISDCDLDADDAELDYVVGTVDTSTDAIGGKLNCVSPRRQSGIPICDAGSESGNLF